MSRNLARAAEFSLRARDAVTLFSAESPGNPGERGNQSEAGTASRGESGATPRL